MSRARDRADGVLHNRTHEDTDGGRESLITFKGEQSGGEISTLAQIQASHDGTSDDEKADLIFKTNDGSDGASPTERMRVDSDGNIGVGINAPSSMLHLFDGGTDTGITLQSKVQASATSSITFMSRDSSNVNQNAVLKNIDGRLQSSAGIMFGSDTAEANALSDYEEGTWTVNVYKGTSALPVNLRYGYYRKVGGLVWLSFYWYHNGGLSSQTNNTNTYEIHGLPFALVHLHNSAYQICPAGYTVVNNTTYYTYHRWQANATDRLQLYGNQRQTAHTTGVLEWAGTGVFMTDD